MYKLLDGKLVSKEHEEKLKRLIKEKMKLVIIKANESKESDKYIYQKVKKCIDLGIEVELKEYKEDVTNDIIVNDIEFYNNDKDVTGIIVELPLYNHLDDDIILNKISLNKDVDGLTDENMSNLINNKECFIPGTVRGILSLLDYYGIDFFNKKVTIINRSKLIGKPLYYYLTNKGVDVNMVGHSTKDIKKICKNSHILITGIGKREVIDKSYIKNNAVVIDAGINVECGQLFGDVFFDDVKSKCDYITKVPGGVGPMTVISLFENLYDAYKKQK